VLIWIKSFTQVAASSLVETFNKRCDNAKRAFPAAVFGLLVRSRRLLR
jgi:hypothetical protein